MRSSTKAIFASILFTLLFFVFSLTEFAQLNPIMNKYFQSLVFSATLVISFFVHKLRIKLFYISFFILALMVLFYLMDNLDLSNSSASIGIGMLLIVSLSYLPELIKKGYMEKL